MKSKFIAFFLLIFAFIFGGYSKSFGQQVHDSVSLKTTDTSKRAQIYEFVDEEAVPLGGLSGLREYIAGELKYPKAAIDSNIQGTVRIRTIIEEDGSVGKTQIVKGIGGGCDEEALRVIQSMPKWKPAKINGKPINYIVTIPVRFSLK